MAISKLATILVKEAARWHDFIAKLNPENYKRIHEAGLVKPLEQYIDGINKGSENIANCAFFNIKDIHGQNPDLSSLGKAHIDLTTNMIETSYPRLSFFKDDISDKVLRAMVNRHESNEAAAATKGRMEMFFNPQESKKKMIALFDKLRPGKKQNYTDEQIPKVLNETEQILANTKHPGLLMPNGQKAIKNISSGHLDMNVLTKERKLVDRFPYRDNPGLTRLKRLRTMSGETKYLDTAGDYDPKSLERFNKKNAQNVMRFGTAPVEINNRRIKTLQRIF